MSTTWRKEIELAMHKVEDSFENMEHSTLTCEELDKPFDDCFGGTHGEPFTLWTKDFVYFPLCYEGAEWAGSAPRWPCDIAMRHQGGGMI